MPTTPAGTTYTARTFRTPAGEMAHWYMDDSKLTAAGIPVVIYCHGNGGPYNQFLTTGAWSGLRNWLMDNGYAVVESEGGGGESWGNDAARTSYVDAFNYVAEQITAGPVVVLGRSMGGLVSYWLAARSPLAHRVAALIVNSGTTDLARRVTYNSPATGQPAILAAFGAANLTEFYRIAPEYDPMQWPGPIWSETDVIQLWGTADDSVPPATNGKAWAQKYGPYAKSITTDERPGGDHSTGNGSYLQTAAMTGFLTLAVPRYRAALRIRSRFAVAAGGALQRLN